jgi:UDP-glucose 4-epimerase
VVVFLVTGGTGQIGGYVCRELLRRGHRVVVFDAQPNLDNIRDIADRVTLVRGDIVNLSELLGALKAHGGTHIIHLAALLVFESRLRPVEATEVNCLGTNNVFEAARLLDLEGVVYASSETVYGSASSYSKGQVDEDDYPLCPADPYSATKLFNERMGAFYREAYGLGLLCLRLTGAWGPGRYAGYTGQFNAFIRDVALGRPAKYPEDFAYRNAKLRWLYVKDAASCFVHAALQAKRARRPLYNAGSPSPFSASQVVEALKALVPDSRIELNLRESPTEVSSRVPGPSGLDVICSRLYSELGFAASYSLEQALSDMVGHERARASAR